MIMMGDPIAGTVIEFIVFDDAVMGGKVHAIGIKVLARHGPLAQIMNQVIADIPEGGSQGPRRIGQTARGANAIVVAAVIIVHAAAYLEVDDTDMVGRAVIMHIRKMADGPPTTAIREKPIKGPIGL